MGDILLEVEPKFNEMKNILSYILAFGNTREDDLISFGIKTMHLSVNEVKDLIDKMAIYTMVEKVIHYRLEPTVIYIKKGNMSMVPIWFELSAVAGTADMIKWENKDVEEEKLILDQATLISTKMQK